MRIKATVQSLRSSHSYLDSSRVAPVFGVGGHIFEYSNKKKFYIQSPILVLYGCLALDIRLFGFVQFVVIKQLLKSYLGQTRIFFLLLIAYNESLFFAHFYFYCVRLSFGGFESEVNEYKRHNTSQSLALVGFFIKFVVIDPDFQHIIPTNLTMCN